MSVPRLSRRLRLRPGGLGAGSLGVVGCLHWTLGTGVLLGVKSARPQFAVDWLPMQIVQPLHTLGALGFLFYGIIALMSVVMRRHGMRTAGALGWVSTGMGVFLLAAGGSVLLGWGSGLEYTSWWMPLTVVPAFVAAALAGCVWIDLRRFVNLSAEGSWLLLMGTLLILLGIVERGAGTMAREVTRALMVEWHALDTMFAGINVSLYGLAILITSAPGGGRPMRPRLLCGVAVFALLSTFGHHHYLSSQPLTFKWLAFGASMLGLLSLWRHVSSLRRGHHAAATTAATVFFRVATAWTVFAVGTGVLLAVPPINEVLHGTHAIVAHSMGSIIGINVMIVIGGLASDLPANRYAVQLPVLQRRARWFSAILLALVVVLAASGVVKGVLRIEHGHQSYQHIVRGLLVPLPAIGLILSLVVIRLMTRIRRCLSGDPPVAPTNESPDRCQSPGMFCASAPCEAQDSMRSELMEVQR
ncbi:MAG: cbb3-type cytochrome c oxidase subunit I [Phycisphaeraceae bacterium]|nr:cbb3-type cytochrome c oxidase subunit I [Phycisphaeraceae bacterium]MCW5762898.1 cbb3-type cytochrome c oxidase subunit I [Phycisphaeraceae bacterium]